jgi:hypothetical protein
VLGEVIPEATFSREAAPVVKVQVKDDDCCLDGKEKDGGREGPEDA